MARPSAPRVALRFASARSWGDEPLDTGRRKGRSLPETGYELQKAMIYRAATKGVDTFFPMDYVTRNRRWAQSHADHVAAVSEDEAVVLKVMVNASDVYEASNPGEYFYDGPKVKGRVVYRQKYASGSKTAAPFVDEGMVGEDWGSSASGLLVTDGDRVLLLKRSPYVQDPGLWGIPGGAVPVDYDTGKRKDAKKSALDEAREEMRGIPSGSVVGKHVFRKPSGFSFTTFVWETDPDSLDRFTPRLNWEHTDWGLFDLDGIKPSGIHPGVIWVLKRMGR